MNETKTKKAPAAKADAGGEEKTAPELVLVEFRDGGGTYKGRNYSGGTWQRLPREDAKTLLELGVVRFVSKEEEEELQVQVIFLKPGRVGNGTAYAGHKGPMGKTEAMKRQAGGEVRILGF